MYSSKKTTSSVSANLIIRQTVAVFLLLGLKHRLANGYRVLRSRLGLGWSCTDLR
jgi:hypothetical protein